MAKAPPRRPPPLTPEEIERGRGVVLHAIGIAGWAFAAELLIVLVDRKVLTDKQARKVMRGAVECVGMMGEVTPHEVFTVAHEVLAGQIEGWKQK